MASRADKPDDWRDQRGTVLHTLQNKGTAKQGVNIWKQREQQAGPRGGAPKGRGGIRRPIARKPAASAKRASREINALDLTSYTKPKQPSFGKLKATPAASNVSASSTAKAKTVKAAPAKASPVKATPVKATPVKAAPIKAAAVKVSPVKASPVKSSPVKAAPVKAEPIKASPVKASAVKASAPSISVTSSASASRTPASSSSAGKMKKRHSKIDLKGDSSLRTAALDVEGLGTQKRHQDAIVSKPAKKKGVGNLWAQKMAQKQEDDFQQNRDKLRNRRKGGVAFMDTQIRNLIKELKGHPGGGGLGYSVDFGTLFSTTSDTMPALAATLACAKKRKVVEFDGHMLMQGVSNNVVITLISDQIEDTPDFQSVIGIRPIKVDAAVAAPVQSKCHVCSKTVYTMDRIAANGKVMHKACFRCSVCQCVLKLANFAFNGGKFFCETHFQQNYKQNTSYNF